MWFNYGVKEVKGVKGVKDITYVVCVQIVL